MVQCQGLNTRDVHVFATVLCMYFVHMSRMENIVITLNKPSSYFFTKEFVSLTWSSSVRTWKGRFNSIVFPTIQTFYCIWFFDQMGWGLVSSGSRLCGLLEHVLFIFIREESCCPVHMFLNIFPVWTRMVKRNVMWKETCFKSMFCWNKNHTLPGNSFGVPVRLFSFSLQTNQNITKATQKPTQSPDKSADWAKRREKAPQSLYAYHS